MMKNGSRKRVTTQIQFDGAFYWQNVETKNLLHTYSKYRIYCVKKILSCIQDYKVLGCNTVILSLLRHV